MGFNITIHLPRCWIFHRYKFLSFYANAFVVVPFSYPGVNFSFINFAKVFWNFLKWTSVYLILDFLFVIWISPLSSITNLDLLSWLLIVCLSHQIGKPTRVTTDGWNTAIKNLLIFVENLLYDVASELPARIKDTNHILDIIDNLNSLDLPLNSILVSFHIINTFPNIYNYLGLSFVKKLFRFI